MDFQSLEKVPRWWQGRERHSPRECALTLSRMWVSIGTASKQENGGNKKKIDYLEFFFTKTGI